MEISFFIYKNKKFMHENEISMHENEISMPKNEISMHENEKFSCLKIRNFQCMNFSCHDFFMHETFFTAVINTCCFPCFAFLPEQKSYLPSLTVWKPKKHFITSFTSTFRLHQLYVCNRRKILVMHYTKKTIFFCFFKRVRHSFFKKWLRHVRTSAFL